jgi:hypothetical protein
VLGAWLAKESVRSVYLVDDPNEAGVLLDNAMRSCRADEVAEIRTLGHTLSRWRGEILNRHRTGASNGPTEGSNFCAKQVKRAGRGFTNPLQAARTPPCRRRHLAEADQAPRDVIDRSPLKPEDPQMFPGLEFLGAGYGRGRSAERWRSDPRSDVRVGAPVRLSR